jgi:hypothetical protein
VVFDTGYDCLLSLSSTAEAAGALPALLGGDLQLQLELLR